jgi:putative tryptophan/tyrosine transport system substrate-binding protein
MQFDQLRRREFISLLGGAVAGPLTARAQQSRIPKVGFLYPGPSSAAAPRIGAFLEGLRAAGYSVPDQVELISRVADGDLTKLSPMAHELVEKKPDVLVAVATSAANVTRVATTTIPIVAMDLETDPVATGMIASLAHPGGNLTGVFFDFPDFRAKLLELLKEIVPNLSKVAVLWDPNVGPAQLKEFVSAADVLKLILVKLEVRNVVEMNQAFAAAKQADADAVILLSSPFIGGNTKLAADLMLRYGLPAVTLFSEFAVNGGLMSYGPILLDIYRRVGGIAAKVLHGSNPADLPVERPTNFELVVNLKTAKAMGITMPTSILLRADLVIE